MDEKTYVLTQSTFRSSDGENDVACYVFTPVMPVKAVIQISHGMCEHMMRYAEFAGFMCGHGYAVCGNDHLGHGLTASDDEALGFTCEGGGAKHIINDLHTMNDKAHEMFGGVPLILLGHSMGSFIARLYLSLYPGTVDDAILSGTAGPDTPAGAAKILAKLDMIFHGSHHRSKFITKLAFGSYQKRYPADSPEYFWVTRDEEKRKAYAADKFCTFTFTSQAYYDLFDILSRVSKRSWAEKIRKDMPVLMIAGDMDPVGSYGKGVTAVYERLRNAGVKDVTLKLYRDAHHEVLNETNRAEVYDDILSWSDRVIKQKDGE